MVKQSCSPCEENRRWPIAQPFMDSCLTAASMAALPLGSSNRLLSIAQIRTLSSLAILLVTVQRLVKALSYRMPPLRLAVVFHPSVCFGDASSSARLLAAWFGLGTILVRLARMQPMV